MLGRLSALFLLGMALLKTLLTRFSGRSPLARFAAYYGTEGIAGVESAEAKTLNRASNCTACGLCDAKEGQRIAESRVGYRGLMGFVLGGTRSLPDYDAVARSISEVPVEAIHDAERGCPEGVPFVRLAELVRHHANRNERAA